MSRDLHKSDLGKKFRVLSVVIGIAVNVLLAYISNRSGLPFYFDTVGTIAATTVGGIFPGIVTALASNTICTLFNSDAIYFGIVSVLLALYTAWFVRDKSFKRVKDIAFFIAMTGAISGGLSAVIQWGFLGEPRNQSVRDLLESTENISAVSKFVLFAAVNILLNMLDKGISLGMSEIIIHLIPQELRTKIRNSGWRQRPLTHDEIKKMDSMSGDSRLSLNQRMALVLLSASLMLIAIMGGIEINLYLNSYKHQQLDAAIKAARFAADVVDADKINDYISGGKSVSGYAETEKLLYQIRDNASSVEYLYIFQMREDGCYYAFDLATKDVPANKAGYREDFEEAIKPHLPEFFAGGEIEPIESDENYGNRIMVYCPIRNSAGECTGYVGADVSLSQMSEYMSNFFLRVILIMSGFLIVILVYSIWITRIYTVYPINTIVEKVEDFISAGTNQDEMDESVRKLRAINVHTGDEMEKLYHAVCNMAANQTEQLRSIRRFSENTERMQDGLIITMADLVENRDSDTGAHVQKTSAYVKIIVEGLERKGYYAEKITPKFMSDVVRSAPLHDVGKINIPDSVLNKPGKLTDEEYAIIKTHTTAGKNIMDKVISTVEGESYLKEARNMAAYHHERWDGKGYPEGLHGEEIPLAARIMAVADVFDALASPRVYKPAFPLEKALSIIQEGAGTQFDPKCVEVFIEALPEVKEVLKKYNTDFKEI